MNIRAKNPAHGLPHVGDRFKRRSLCRPPVIALTVSRSDFAQTIRNAPRGPLSRHTSADRAESGERSADWFLPSMMPPSGRERSRLCGTLA